MWFRHDLRVTDNPALNAAMAKGHTRAVYFWCQKQWQDHNLSPARLKLTQLALIGLNESLAKLGVELEIVLIDSFLQVPGALNDCLTRHRIANVYVNAEYALDERRRDREVKALCRSIDVAWHPYHGSMMQMPGTLKTGEGNPYKVFTPFKRAWYRAWQDTSRQVLPVPKTQGEIASLPVPLPLPLLETEVPLDAALFPLDEQSALSRLSEFSNEKLHAYGDSRDYPASAGTSRLSAALTVGLISPLQCFQAAVNLSDGDLSRNPGAEVWVSELIWREFYLNVIYCWPEVCKGQAFRKDMDKVAWRYNEEEFASWCEGTTGFPIVDAAMRQLNETGWMHNRLRMVTAMFLSKYLLIDWRWGEQYFMSHLIDGHFAANNGGWQWSASTGTDAAPYFRLLSPTRQAERFDSDAVFMRRFLPELESLSAKQILKPGSPELLASGYPAPMIDLKVAREACLSAFKAVRG